MTTGGPPPPQARHRFPEAAGTDLETTPLRTVGRPPPRNRPARIPPRRREELTDAAVVSRSCWRRVQNDVCARRIVVFAPAARAETRAPSAPTASVFTNERRSWMIIAPFDSVC